MQTLDDNVSPKDLEIVKRMVTAMLDAADGSGMAANVVLNSMRAVSLVITISAKTGNEPEMLMVGSDYLRQRADKLRASR
jgi:hypothetical protein